MEKSIKKVGAASKRLLAYQTQPGAQMGIPSKGWPTVAADNNYLDSLVETGQFTRKQVDEAWAAAKKKATEAADENPNIVPSYAYTTSIFQDLLGIKDRNPDEPPMETAALKIMAAHRLLASKEVDFDLVRNEAAVKSMLKALGLTIKSTITYEDDKGDPRSVVGAYKVAQIDTTTLKDNVDTYFYDAKLKGDSGKKVWWEIEGDGGLMLEMEYDSSGVFSFEVREP